MATCKIQHPQKRRLKLNAELKTLKNLGWKIYPPRKWKPGQKNKWLHSLRDIIGKSQAEFAAMIGEDPRTIINIENGRKRLDGILATKIQAVTGISALTYLLGDNWLLDFSGRAPYTRADFEHWKKNYSDNDEKSIHRFLELASDSLSLMLQAAKKSAWKNRLPALQLSFQYWCNESAKKFQLRKSLDEILAGRKYIDKRTMRYGEWRKKESAGCCEFYGFVDDPQEPDDEFLTLRVETHPGWVPCGDMKAPRGERPKAQSTPT